MILFDIASKSRTSSAAARDVITMVFLRAFNEKLGYSYQYPRMADLERKLDADGKLQKFRDRVEELEGSSWMMLWLASTLHRIRLCRHWLSRV